MSDDRHRQDAVSGKAWSDFCDALKAAGDLVVEHSTDDLDRIEGFRYLSRLARGGLTAFIENGDRIRPHILPIPFNLKIGCDNPDADYRNVGIDPAHTYRITGTRGTVNFLSIGAYSGGYGTNSATPGAQGNITDNDPDPDRRLDIIASVEPPAALEPGQQWLEMSPATTVIIVRNFFLDRTTERSSELSIECVDPPTAHPEPFSADDLARGLAMSGFYVHGIVQRFHDWLVMFREHPDTLEFLPVDDGPGGWGDPNQLFRHGCWRLGDDEAFVITVPPIDAFYWNFQLNNMWEESLDYHRYPVTVNAHTATYEPDGRARIVVSPVDPGWGNWISTAHHSHGTWGLRYNQVVEDLPPTIDRVALAALPGLA
ncbi:MAG: DUF1214 domain-containing protein [Actinomycetota bacterium]